MVESWHIPRALSDEALRLLTTLPMEEIEARLRGPAPAADGEVAELALRAINEMQHEPIAVFPPFEELAEAMNLNLREGEATRLIGRALEIWGRPKPFHVSDRMPEQAEMTDDGEVWIEGDNWEPHKWILGPITKYAIRSNRRWLAAHALPLPEVE